MPCGAQGGQGLLLHCASSLPEEKGTMALPQQHQRTVFFVSDGTGITAETFGGAILNQFEFKQPLRHVRLPFVSNMENH